MHGARADKVSAWDGHDSAESCRTLHQPAQCITQYPTLYQCTDLSSKLSGRVDYGVEGSMPHNSIEMRLLRVLVSPLVSYYYEVGC